ncbi:hypothetical protein F5B20DRAFT_142188 [Whalleya microplaca]|nr:hypothetical protein F5B20DRAFT_142188 [Whalleya microplaca]
MGKEATPKNWPSSLPYLSQPSYSPDITPSQHQALKTQPPDLTTTSNPGIIPRSLPRGPSALARILPVRDPAHPAHGQCGLFATRALPPGSLILPYYGIVHAGGAAAHAASDYDLWLDREAGVAVDAARAGNEARFVNDYRGVRERPNAEFRECWDVRRGGEKGMAVFVLPAGKNGARGRGKGGAGIAKGEEILVSYGKGFWGKRRDEGLEVDEA